VGGAEGPATPLGHDASNVFALIHSPLVGPTTWSPVKRELERRGRAAVVPALLEVADAPAARAAEAVEAATEGAGVPLVLVGHSGAGVLLPAIADAVTADVAALIFVDAFLPPAAGSAPLAPPELVHELTGLARGGVLPPWSDWFGEDAMRGLVPDDSLRAALVGEMPHLPLRYFESRVAMPSGWTRRPCAYLLFGAAHAATAAEARNRGWAVAELPAAQHLALATDPVAVTDALLELERRLSR
jgi:Alpha/beta hydrolase family